MNPPPSPKTNARREALLSAWQTVRSCRSAAESSGVVGGGELAEAEARYNKLAREYAVHRITEGLGPDKELLSRDFFEEVLLSIAKPDPFARKIPETGATCLSRDTMTAMLTSGTVLGEMLRALAASSAPGDVFDQQAPLKRLVREWAFETRSDPFINQCLRDVSGHLADFSTAAEDAAVLLNRLRMRYELENRDANRLRLRRGADGKLELVAVSAWGALTDAFPADVDEVYANVAAAELAAERIDHAAKDINRELSRFFAELIPRYFSLLSKLPRRRRRERTNGVRLTAALAAELVEAAQATDFVAAPRSALGFERKSLPKQLKLLTTQPGYKRVRDAVIRRRVQDASTTIMRPSAPAPESGG